MADSTARSSQTSGGAGRRQAPEGGRIAATQNRTTAESSHDTVVSLLARYTEVMDLGALPGGDLVQEGLADLARGLETMPALLVSIGAPRLRRIGLPVPEGVIASPERRLYDLLAESDSDSAHSRYNALVQRLVSFENAAECGGL